MWLQITAIGNDGLRIVIRNWFGITLKFASASEPVLFRNRIANLTPEIKAQNCDSNQSDLVAGEISGDVALSIANVIKEAVGQGICGVVYATKSAYSQLNYATPISNTSSEVTPSNCSLTQCLTQSAAGFFQSSTAAVAISTALMSTIVAGEKTTTADAISTALMSTIATEGTIANTATAASTFLTSTNAESIISATTGATTALISTIATGASTVTSNTAITSTSNFLSSTTLASITGQANPTSGPHPHHGFEIPTWAFIVAGASALALLVFISCIIKNAYCSSDRPQPRDLEAGDRNRQGYIDIDADDALVDVNKFDRYKPAAKPSAQAPVAEVGEGGVDDVDDKPVYYPRPPSLTYR